MFETCKPTIMLFCFRKYTYPSSASISTARKEILSQLRRKIRLSRSRYSRARIRKASVEGSANSETKESPSITRNVAKKIWSPGGSDVRNVSESTQVKRYRKLKQLPQLVNIVFPNIRTSGFRVSKFSNLNDDGYFIVEIHLIKNKILSNGRA